MWICPQNGYLGLDSLPGSVQICLLGNGQSQFIVKDKLRSGGCFVCRPVPKSMSQLPCRKACRPHMNLNVNSKTHWVTGYVSSKRTIFAYWIHMWKIILVVLKIYGQVYTEKKYQHNQLSVTLACDWQAFRILRCAWNSKTGAGSIKSIATTGWIQTKSIILLNVKHTVGAQGMYIIWGQGKPIPYKKLVIFPILQPF